MVLNCHRLHVYQLKNESKLADGSLRPGAGEPVANPNLEQSLTSAFFRGVRPTPVVNTSNPPPSTAMVGHRCRFC